MNLRLCVISAGLLALAACSAPVDGDTVGETASEVRRCAEDATVPGIDVSDYQPNVDFDAVRSSGRRFAFLRVSDGVRHPDEAFARHWPAAKKAGLFRGAYQYFRASQDALVQANMVVPIDLLEPIYQDLRTRGGANRPARPWLGMYTTEADGGGQFVVAGLADGGPADRAGVKRGDVVLEVAGNRVSALAELFRNVWRLGPAGVDVPLTLAREGQILRVNVRSADRNTFLKKPQLH